MTSWYSGKRPADRSADSHASIFISQETAVGQPSGKVEGVGGCNRNVSSHLLYVSEGRAGSSSDGSSVSVCGVGAGLSTIGLAWRTVLALLPCGVPLSTLATVGSCMRSLVEDKTSVMHYDQVMLIN